MDIQKILHSVPSTPKRKKMGTAKGIIHPVREWLLGLLFFFTVVVLGGAVSAYTFLQYTNIAVIDANIIQTHAMYNQILAQTALKNYQLRKDNFDTRKNVENTAVPIILEVASSTPIVPQKNTTTPTTTKSVDIEEELQLAN